MTQVPMIVESTLTKPSKWFVVTKYTIKRGVNTVTGKDTTYLKATVKHDVTSQMLAILKNRKK